MCGLTAGPTGFLYKYKPLSCGHEDWRKDLYRALDVIENGRIYASAVGDLNDPMEGLGAVPFSGYAGVSVSTNIGKVPQRLKRHILPLKVVSATTNPVSPQMWAHYASGYKGIAVQFDGRLTSAAFRKVNYIDAPLMYGSQGPDASDAEMAVMAKHKDWSYEDEWRAIVWPENPEEKTFVSLGSVGPSAVILGHLCQPEHAKAVADLCERKHVPLYETYIADWWYSVAIVPFGFEVALDGRCLERQVERECEERGIPNCMEWFDRAERVREGPTTD